MTLIFYFSFMKKMINCYNSIIFSRLFNELLIQEINTLWICSELEDFIFFSSCTR